MIPFRIRLILRDRRGKQFEKQVIHQIENNNPITIVRDPSF